MKVVLTIILSLCFVLSDAQTFRGGEIFRIGDSDIYWAAVKTAYFKDYVARQEEDCWCWAACVQMVLNYQGVDVDQETLVLRAKGMRINEGGGERLTISSGQPTAGTSEATLSPLKWTIPIMSQPGHSSMT